MAQAAQRDEKEIDEITFAVPLEQRASILMMNMQTITN